MDPVLEVLSFGLYVSSTKTHLQEIPGALEPAGWGGDADTAHALSIDLAGTSLWGEVGTLPYK